MSVFSHAGSSDYSFHLKYKSRFDGGQKLSLIFAPGRRSEGQKSEPAASLGLFGWPCFIVDFCA